MKLREDTELLDKMVGNKILTLTEAKRFSALPLFEVPNLLLCKEWSEWIIEGSKTTPTSRIDFEHLPYNEMVFFIRTGPTKEPQKTTHEVVGTCHFYCKLKVVDEGRMELSYSDDYRYWITCEFNHSSADTIWLENPSIKMDANVRYVNRSKAAYDMLCLQYRDPIPGEDGLTRPNFLMHILQMFISYNESNDRYFVSVSKNKKPKLSKNRVGEIGSVIGPRIIYLDSLPTEANNKKDLGGVGLPKAPHQRRGSWCTLRAERYKNHPLYQVEKAIYRKPAWIGDRTRIVHGATYTVIDKQVNLED